MREAPYMGTGMDLLQIALRVMNEGLRPPVPPNAPATLQYAPHSELSYPSAAEAHLAGDVSCAGRCSSNAGGPTRPSGQTLPACW
jgi:hypothetical protein